MSAHPGPWPQEVFLSHCSADRVVASALADTLRAHGVPVWYSTTNILGAQQWHDEIGSAPARCDWFVLLLSPDAVESVWVKRELLYALNDARYANRIVPVVLADCDPLQLSWTLDAIQRIDLRADFDVACRAILRVWGVGLDEGRLRFPHARTGNL